MIELTDLNRRRWLQLGGLGLAGCTLADLLGAEAVAGLAAPRAKACILFYMCGGASHIDMFDLKPAAPSEIRGPFEPIATRGEPVCEHLPLLAGQMQHFVQVRSMQHDESIHPQAVYQMLTGYRQSATASGGRLASDDFPHIGSALIEADRTPAAMPKFLRLPEPTMIGTGPGAITPLRGQTAGMLRSDCEPLPVDIGRDGSISKPQLGRHAEITLAHLARRQALLNQIEQRSGPDGAEEVNRLAAYQQQAFDLLGRDAVQSAFEIEREPAGVRDRYGRHRQGVSLLLTRRLIEAQARFVTVYWGSEDQDWADGKGPRLAGNPWDTHRNHFPLLKESLLPRLDQSLSALVEDLHQRGLLSETLLVWMGDFGRTPRISKPWASRDHWAQAFTVLLAGAGLPGGMIHGQTDRDGARVTDLPVSPADLTATIFALLGIEPQMRIRTANRGSHQISTGRPVGALM